MSPRLGTSAIEWIQEDVGVIFPDSLCFWAAYHSKSFWSKASNRKQWRFFPCFCLLLRLSGSIYKNHWFEKICEYFLTYTTAQDAFLTVRSGNPHRFYLATVLLPAMTPVYPGYMQRFGLQQNVPTAGKAEDFLVTWMKRQCVAGQTLHNFAESTRPLI